MDRRSFVLSASAGALVVARPFGALADFAAARATTQAALFDPLPRPKAGQWVRYIMGSGVKYQKQIGLARETTENGSLEYVETQVGTPGGSCNPNTMKRVYIRSHAFGSLFSQQAVLANVANSGTTLTRWGDIGGGQTQTPADARLRLLDVPSLYDDRPCRVTHVAHEAVTLPAGTFATTHVVALFDGSIDAHHALERLEVWTTPQLPYGIAKLRAIQKDQDPYELSLFSHGVAFKPELNMSLATVRAITPDGTHVQTS